jgi:nucleotide-binding universal stress UspA family protein
MVALKNILVATDFGEPSAVALAYGRDLARSYGAKLHVLHVIEDVVIRYSSEIGFALPELQADLEQAARRDLEQVITDDDRRTLAPVTAIETGVNIASTIVGYAAEYGIDLIVTGTHGRGAVSHMLMGSVAERVVRSAPCPVLTVRAHERDFIAPDTMVAVAKS